MARDESVKETINMSERPKSTKENRREFLKGMAMFGGAALALVARPGIANAPPNNDEKPVDAIPKGYHVTSHILDYYDKARF